MNVPIVRDLDYYWNNLDGASDRINPLVSGLISTSTLANVFDTMEVN